MGVLRDEARMKVVREMAARMLAEVGEGEAKLAALRVVARARHEPYDVRVEASQAAEQVRQRWVAAHRAEAQGRLTLQGTRQDGQLQVVAAEAVDGREADRPADGPGSER